MKKRFREINSRLMKSASLTLIGTGALGPIMNLINNLIYLVVVAAGGFFCRKGLCKYRHSLFLYALYAQLCPADQ